MDKDAGAVQRWLSLLQLPQYAWAAAARQALGGKGVYSRQPGSSTSRGGAKLIIQANAFGAGSLGIL